LGGNKFTKDVNSIKERIISKHKGLVFQYSAIDDAQRPEEDIKMQTLSPRRSSLFEQDLEIRPHRL
jgi:hypothetical protein